MSAPNSLDSNLYPATYRTSIWVGGKRISIFVLFVLFTVLGRSRFNLTSPSWLWVFTFVLIGGVVLIATTVAFARVTLYADRIERATWFGKKVMRRGDVAGLRLIGPFWFKSPALFHKYDADLPFPIPPGIKKDAAWDNWMAIASNLSALDEQKILADAAAYPNLGVTEQERQRRWDITNRIATACMSVSIFGMLCVFVPFIAKFAAGLLVVIPWVVLTNMRLHGVYFSGSPKKTPVVGNSVALFGAGAGLGIFGFLYPTMVINHQKALQFFPPDAAHALYLIVGPLCGLVLVVATLIVIFSAPQMKASSARYAAIFVLVPLILLVDWGYGIGAALEFDAVFDRANLWFKP